MKTYRTLLLIFNLVLLTGCEGILPENWNPLTNASESSQPNPDSGSSPADTVPSTSPLTPSPISSPIVSESISGNKLISDKGIGPAQLGMTLGELQQALGPAATVENQPQFWVDYGAIAIRQGKEIQFYVLYPQGQPLQASDPITLLYTDNPTYRTSENIGPGTPLPQAVKAYGVVSLRYNTQAESREELVFTKSPSPNIWFRSNGAQLKEGTAGIYPENPSEPKTSEPKTSEPKTSELKVTETFRATAAIGAVLVQKQRPAAEQVRGIDCDRPKGTQQADICALAAFETADAKLEETFQAVLLKNNSTDVQRLLDDQLTWIQDRDQRCQVPGESIRQYPASVSQCLVKLTQERMTQLEQQRNQPSVPQSSTPPTPAPSPAGSTTP